MFEATAETTDISKFTHPAGQILAMVDRIRHLECDMGESFTDYFLDSQVGDKEWCAYLREMGHSITAEEIEEFVRPREDRPWTPTTCYDQCLKFEPHCTAREEALLDWDEDTYRKDVALWVEFMLRSEEIMEAFLEFESEYLREDDE